MKRFLIARLSLDQTILFDGYANSIWFSECYPPKVKFISIIGDSIYVSIEDNDKTAYIEQSNDPNNITVKVYSSKPVTNETLITQPC